MTQFGPSIEPIIFERRAETLRVTPRMWVIHNLTYRVASLLELNILLAMPCISNYLVSLISSKGGKQFLGCSNKTFKNYCILEMKCRRFPAYCLTTTDHPTLPTHSYYF